MRTLSAQVRSYRAWRHLAPRTLLPVLSGNLFLGTDPGKDLGTGVGLQLRGVDLLRTWTYTAESRYQAGRRPIKGVEGTAGHRACPPEGGAPMLDLSRRNEGVIQTHRVVQTHRDVTLPGTRTQYSPRCVR